MNGERSPEELKEMGIIVENTEGDKLKKFEQLRESTHLEIERETKERTEKNPKPTEEELLVGAFKEELEPQVRDAVFSLYRKGYSTESSGFYGEHGEIQQIDGYFEIDQETEEKLRLLGVQVRTELRGEETGNKKYTSIIFKPENPEVEGIKAKWNEIIKTLPDKKTPVELSVSGGSEEFRKKFAPERKDLRRKMIEKRLFLGDISPEVTQELEEELLELK